MTDNPRPLRKQVIVPPGHGPCIENSCRGNALPHSTEARQRIPEPLGRSIKTLFSIRKSAPKHVPLIFAASVCATFHMVFFVTLDSLTSSSTRCSTSDTACSYIHYTCRVQQVRAGGIPGTELSHKILLYFKFHMVILDPHTGIYWGGKTTFLVPQTGGAGVNRRRGSYTTVSRYFDD